MGDTEIVFKASEPRKKVETAGDWMSAWNRTMRATTFIFSYRGPEMQDYAEYIQGEFAAKVPTIHPRIIMYDIAVRDEVCGAQRMRLTDFSHFSRLYSAIVAPDGVEILTNKRMSNRSLSSHPSTNRSNTCHRFNSINGCSSSDRDCRYKHVCKLCHKAGHSKIECGEKKRQ
jgi:hypothetical protein